MAEPRPANTPKQASPVAPLTFSEARPLPRLSWGDPVMKPVLQRLDQARTCNGHVVLMGEMGTGKTLAARTLVSRVARAPEPLAIIDCRSPDADQLDKLLFEGDGRAPGIFARAHTAPVVLAGLDALDERLQSKLIHALDERLIEGPESGPRIIGTSREDLSSLCNQGRLRQELFLHLAVITVRLPPVRARKLDLPLIAGDLLSRHAVGGSKPPEISAEAMLALISAPWPGNVRELRNCLLRASHLAAGGPILPQHLRLDALASPATPTLAEVERQTILRALEEVGGHRRKAAQRLGIGLRTLYDKIKRYSIDA